MHFQNKSYTRIKREWPLEDLVGTGEMAKMGIIDINGLHAWRAKYSEFPKPLTKVGNTLIFSKEEFNDFLKIKWRLENGIKN